MRPLQFPSSEGCRGGPIRKHISKIFKCPLQCTNGCQPCPEVIRKQVFGLIASHPKKENYEPAFPLCP